MKLFIHICLAALLFINCSDEKIDDGRDLTENEKVNTYIKEKINEPTSIYLWTEEVAGKSYSLTAEPDIYLSHLIYEEDQWSHVERDASLGRAEVYENDDIETGFGYYLLYYRTSDGFILAKVAYVYPDSPADKAGLKRGDLITKINDNDITQDNMQDLLYADKVKISLSKLEGNSILPPYTTLSLTAANTQIDPVLDTSIIDLNGTKIGYMLYTRFVYSGDKDLEHLNEIFRGFKRQGVTEFILDLRYNPGGYERAAIRLASLLAPASALNNQEILLQKQWNKYWQSQYEQRPENNLISRLDNTVPQNARLDNLNRLWVITSSSTASSSEVVINGLKPFYNDKLQQVGSTTYGKYVGGVTQIPEDEEINDWRLTLITCTDVNSKGESVKGGLNPDHSASEDLADAHPFGDPSEGMLETTLGLIQGKNTLGISSRSIATFTPLQVNRNIYPMLILPEAKVTDVAR